MTGFQKGIKTMSNKITQELLTELKKVDAYDDLFIPGVMACVESIEDQKVILDFLKHGSEQGYEVSDETITMLAIYLDQDRNEIN